MRVTASQLCEHGGEVAPLSSAHGVLRRRAGLVLHLRDERGNRGLGEASPLPGYSTDSLAACRAALSSLPEMVLDPERPIVPQLAAASAPLAAPAARFALESALVDLLGRRLGRPAHVLLGARVRERPLSALLDGDLISAARGARARGIRTVKVKLGARDFASELAALTALRRAEPELALRLDANQSFPLAQAPAVLEALAELRPELVEEPIADGFLGELTTSPVALAADESLLGPWVALEPALRSGVIRAVILKPMALGGLARCLELGARAQALGAGVVVTHLWDGPIALAAAAALALALPATLPCGLDHHPGLAAWPRLELPCLGPAAVLATAHPGLGLELP